MKDLFIVKGNKGFTFEFKSLDNGNIAFIRYLEGDRQFASKNYIFTGLYDNSIEKLRAIDRELSACVGHSFRLIKKVQNHFYPTVND